ncbi:hypothetical protein BDZ88DRAFT_202774 [Geranomyces variabilis]|nr:hypothetical protein BDZ88DRAFT_202774 [Geranomyces variabilis]KAJ3133630.1 hypothetical protein HDU90_005708 [Geranomyces variabilis]
MFSPRALIFALFALLAASSTLASPIDAPTNCSNPAPMTCNFYTDCLETAHPCGADGYAEGYGSVYCNAFKDNINRFSPKGQVWIQNVMHCLQVDLIPVITQDLTCPKIKDFAFGTHPGCYVQAGFCKLPPTDLAVLLNIVGLKELLSPETILQGLKVGGDCSKEYIADIISVIFKHHGI